MNTELQLRIDRIQEICGAWGLYEPGNANFVSQQLKAKEEIGEIAKWHLKKNKEEVMDGIGDTTVCWVNAEKLGGPSIMNWPCRSECVNVVILNLQANIPDIGDLEAIANHYGATLLECIDAAIEVISKRKGVISNGAFVKDE